MVVVEEGEVACSNKDDKLKRETRDKQTCILRQMESLAFCLVHCASD